MLWVWLRVFLVAGDIPVNCKFHVSGDTHEGSLYNPETSCGHSQPDQVMPILEGEGWSFPMETAVEVALEEPNRATSKVWGLGSWTM